MRRTNGDRSNNPGIAERVRKPHPGLLGISVVALQSTAVATAVQAQQSVTGPPQEITVTGSRLPITPNGLAQSVTVMDAQRIQQFNPGRLEEILSQVSGVYVDSAGGTGGFSSLYMRGGENSHLLVLLDGVKVNDSTTTRGSAYDLSAIDVNQIERIEILRGPASAIHGGEALAGVVNIITRRPGGSGVQGSSYGGVGEDGYARIGGRLSMGSNLVRGDLAIGVTRDGETREGATFRLNTFSGSLRLSPGSMEGEFFARRTERQSLAFPDDSGGPRLAVNRQSTERDAQDSLISARIAWGGAPSLLIQGGASAYEREEFADNAFVDAGMRFPVPAFTSDSTFRRSSAHLTATRHWSASTSLAAGIELQNEKGSLTSVGDFLFDGNPVTLTFVLERGTDSFFVEGRFRPAPRLSLQIGLRRDEVEGLSAETTSHLGLVWTLPNATTTLKASYSEGFKPPSFFALGFPIGANPALEPESSRNVELALVQRVGGNDSSAQVSLFHIDYKNLVDFDGATFTNINRGIIVVDGIEATLSLRLATRLKSQLGLTLLDISERDGLAPLRNRPERKLTAAVVYDTSDRASLFAVMNYSGEFLDRSNPTGDIDMPGFAKVDAGYSLRVGRLAFKLSIDNLLNNAYEQFVGFPAQDRRVRVEVRGEF